MDECKKSMYSFLIYSFPARPSRAKTVRPRSSGEQHTPVQDILPPQKKHCSTTAKTQPEKKKGGQKRKRKGKEQLTENIPSASPKLLSHSCICLNISSLLR